MQQNILTLAQFHLNYSRLVILEQHSINFDRPREEARKGYACNQVVKTYYKDLLVIIIIM